MARYTKARSKLSRRVNRNLFLKGSRSYSAKDEVAKKPFKPSKTKKRRFSSSSEYGLQLTEKQALRFTYGLLEKQLGNTFKQAFKKTGDTGQIVLKTLESRLDNIVYRASLSNSRAQARQLVNHGHFEVNGVKVNIPSFVVKPGDIVTVKANKQKNNFWTNFQLEVPNEVPSWLDASKKFTVKVLSEPLEADLPQQFNISKIVEYYSRKVA